MSLILVTVLGIVLVALTQGWLMLQLRGQQTRLQIRIDDLDRRPPSSVSNAEIQPVRAAPPFEIPNLAGSSTTLAALLTPAKPLLLAFVEPPCGPCYELLPDLGGWQRVYGDRLNIAIVSSGDLAQNRAMTAEYGIAPETILVQPDHAVNTAYAIEMEPGGVLIRPDGRIVAGPVRGAQAVRKLVADALGLAMPEPIPAASDSPRAIEIGETVPALRRPDLDGMVVDLAELRGETTLLLFWSPGCGHCKALLPDIRTWDQQPDGPRLLVITNGPVALNKEVGLHSTIIPDDDASIKRAFGVISTPSAVVVDSLGLVASDVARGADAVRKLVEERFAPARYPS